MEQKTNLIEKLIKCCRSSGASGSNSISDCVLAHCIKLLLQNPHLESNPELKDQIDSLIRLINDVELKVGELKQLFLKKTACRVV